MRIKKGDEWKAALTTLKGLFEPTVMFFGLTNSLATFQAIMNELLRDLINIGKVGSFIDVIMVGTDTEEEHNELVAEVLKRLEENNLYVKPEGIRIEEVKVKAVLYWPVLKSVKDI